MKENYTLKSILLLLVFLFSLTVKSQSCADISQRVYASNQSWSTNLLGNVSNPALAVDANSNTYSQINTGIVAIGLGTTYQTLSWGGTDIAAGIPVSVKLGTNSGLLEVGSTVTIQARRDGANVGSAQAVTSSLLSLVSGESVYDFTFIPQSGGVAEPYDEVRIIASATVSLGFSVRVYEAYYHDPSSTIADCDDDIIDLFYGVEDLGLGVLTATVGVVNPWDVADGNPETYATLQNGVALLARAQLTAVFSSPMQGSDELEISISNPGNILSVQALSGFTIQRYNGANEVGTPLGASSSLVSVSFLGTSDSEATLVISPNDNLVYDRVKISLGGVAEVLNGMRIHEIKRRAGFSISSFQDHVIHLEQGDSNLFTLEDPTGCTTFQVFDESNNPLPMSGNTFELPSGLIGGQIYSFYVQGNRYGCSFGERKQIVVIVSDTSVNPEDCPDVFNRVYATDQSWGTVLLGGTTSNPSLAVDGDPTSHSTITVALGVLGLGTTYQNLSWGGAVIPAGTPVSIKLGPDVGFLGVGSGLSVIGRRNGSNIGVIQNIDGALLSLISGENVYEYTFVPSAGGVPHEYDEIRIALGGVIAAGISVRIYEAYYHTTTETLVNCNGGDILDLFYGVEDLGIGVLTGATIGVSNPQYAVDGDPETYATFQNTLALLAGAQLTTVFSSPMQGHDELEISLSHQTGLLSVEALSGFSIQRYNGSTPVGDSLLSSSNLISINFLGNSDSEATLILTPNDDLVYDRIKISLGGVLGLLDNLRIHEIKRRAGFHIDGVQDNVIYFEQGDSNSFTIEDPTNCTTFQVFDESNNPLTMSGNTFELPSGLVDGQIYTFYVQGSRYGCLFGDSKQIVVIVSDTSINPDDCPDVFNRVYATQQSSNSILFGSVQNPNLAVDGDVSTHSSLIVPIGVLGLGTTYQDLSWDNTISAGTAVTIKLSPDVGLVGVLSGLSVMARHEGVNLGNRHYIDGNLLSLVSGENVFEYTFVPNIGGIPQDYDEIRIALGGVVAAGISVKIYEAYHHTSTETLVDCGTGDVLDLFYGVEDLGIQVLTATVGVEDAWDAVDGDDQTYATIHSGISVLAQAHLTVVFSTPIVNTDKLEINISKPGQLLTVGLLDGFSIQRYYGANAIGGPLDFSSSLLSLELLNPGDDQATIVFAPDDGLPYDRVKVSLGGVATVLDALRIHEVVRKPFIKLENSNNLEVMICIEDLIQFEQVSVCTTYEVRDENGILLTASTDDIYAFDLPDNVVEGNSYTYTVQASRYGCSFGASQEITVIVLPKATVSELDDILVNGGTLLSLCLETGAEVELQVSISDDSTIINPVFVWYDSDGELVAGGEAGTLDLGMLTVGSYNFSVGVFGDNFCESLPEERKEVTFLVEYGGLPSDIDIDADNDEVCFTDSVTFTPSSTTVTSPTFKWYLTNDTSSPIMDGSTDGNITYTINALGVLSVTGLAPGTTNTYFVTVSGDGVCENTAGNLAQVTVIVNDDIATPTTTDASQNFCLADSPTVSDIQVNESGVIWYDSATGGTAYDSTDALVNGTYYGVLVSVDECESSVRLEVSVTVGNLETPTTTDTSQNFCLANSPTISDIEVNESGVIWYDSATGGTAYDLTDTLVDGIYYGVLASTEGCESSVRLAIVVTVGDMTTPTTSTTSQYFCLANSPTVSDIQVNESGVIWYDSATGGTAYDSTDALVNGTYYGVLVSVDECESSVRLEVSVTVGNLETPTTTDTSQNFCLVDSPTISDIEVNGVGVIWYDLAIGGTAYDSTYALVNGTYYGTSTSIDGCESSDRLEVTVVVEDVAAPTTLSTSQDFCLVDSPIISDIQVNESGVIWYDSATGETAYDSTDVLVDGTYYGVLASTEGCESSVRLEVVVTVGDMTTPTTSSTSQYFCLANSPTISDIEVNESGVIWYDLAVGGTAYDSTDALVNGIYYGALVSEEGCESSVRLEISVVVDDVVTPTGDSEQNFCIVSQPTFLDIQVNETGVVWYDVPEGGVAYDFSDYLIDGVTYYGGIVLSEGCESAMRLAVTVNLIDLPSPTSDSSTLLFCVVDQPTISDLHINESNVIWYDAPIGGVVYDNDTLLINGITYYAALVTSEGCESINLLAITVVMNDIIAPTTNATLQEFCLSDLPIISDIEVNESGVVWYDSITGGNAYVSTDILVSGIYYAAQVSVDGCESSDRLEVEVLVHDGGEATIISDVSGDICLNTVVTYTTESDQSNYNWEVIGGEIILGGTTQDNFVTITWTSEGNTSVSVSYDGNNMCYIGDTTLLEQNVKVCADITISKEVNNLNPMAGEEIVFTVTVTNSGPNDFDNVIISEVLQSGFSYISSEASIGIYSHLSGEWNVNTLSANQIATLKIVVKVLESGDYMNIASIVSTSPVDADIDNNIASVVVEPICLFVFNEFSPNGDGSNEFFIISCIEDYPNNELKIFNKYGSLVYQHKGYNNTWNGIANTGGVPNSAEVLPSDTYYYVLELEGFNNPKKGWLFIMR